MLQGIFRDLYVELITTSGLIVIEGVHGKTTYVAPNRLKDSRSKLFFTSLNKKGEFDMRSRVTWAFFPCTTSISFTSANI